MRFLVRTIARLAAFRQRDRVYGRDKRKANARALTT
jgi:hypothetical protein